MLLARCVVSTTLGVKPALLQASMHSEYMNVFLLSSISGSLRRCSMRMNCRPENG